MPALLTRMSRDSKLSAAARICAALVTSKVRGVTRASGWARGWRVPAYTRAAPRLRASVTSACPMPRFAPVISIVLPSIFMSVAPVVRGPRRLSGGSLIQTSRLPATRRDSPSDFPGSLADPRPRVLLRPARKVVPTLRAGSGRWTLVSEEPGQVAGRERGGHARRWHGAARPVAPASEVVAGPGRAGGPGRRAG